MSWTDPVTDWDSFDLWLEFTGGNLFNQRVGLYHNMRQGGARFDCAAELEASVRHADWVFAEPIAHYLAQVVAAPGEWPDAKNFPPGALSLLEFRFRHSGDWLRSHAVKGRNPIAYPACSQTELLQWLCGAFWEEHGRRLAAESLILDNEYRDALRREMFELPPRELPPKRRRRPSRPTIINCDRRAARPKEELASWGALADWLEAEVPVFHGFPHGYDLLRDRGHSFSEMEAVNATVRSMDDANDEILRPILVKFAQRGSWPREAIHPDFGALLGLRIEMAARWARTHVMRDRCFIDFPAVPFRRFLRWMLVNWWDRPGRYMAADQLMLMMVADLKG